MAAALLPPEGPESLPLQLPELSGRWRRVVHSGIRTMKITERLLPSVVVAAVGTVSKRVSARTVFQAAIKAPGGTVPTLGERATLDPGATC